MTSRPPARGDGPGGRKTRRSEAAEGRNVVVPWMQQVEPGGVKDVACRETGGVVMRCKSWACIEHTVYYISMFIHEYIARAHHDSAILRPDKKQNLMRNLAA